MFPWVDGFHWTATHIIFLSLFFAAVVIIVATFASAIFRAASDFRGHRANEMCWRENFAELPEEERRCRHELAGRVESRICDNAFDCRECANYPNFAAIPANPPSNVGVTYLRPTALSSRPHVDSAGMGRDIFCRPGRVCESPDWRARRGGTASAV